MSPALRRAHIEGIFFLLHKIKSLHSFTHGQRTAQTSHRFPQKFDSMWQSNFRRAIRNGFSQFRPKEVKGGSKVLSLFENR